MIRSEADFVCRECPQTHGEVHWSETALIIAQKTGDARSQIDENEFAVRNVDNVDNADKNRNVLFGRFWCRLQTAYTKVDNVDNY